MLLAACGGEYTPRTGDLLFQLTAAEGMTDAIVAATERGEAVTFSHVGIVEATAGGAFVVEAVDTSVRRTPLGEFLARSARRGGRPIAAVGRVRGADSTVVRCDVRTSGWDFPTTTSFCPPTANSIAASWRGSASWRPTTRRICSGAGP